MLTPCLFFLLTQCSSYSGYKDELAWAGLWLFRATGNSTYLQIAKVSAHRYPTFFYLKALATT